MHRSSLTILICLVVSGFAVAQIPDEFSNLEVLPKDIGKRVLIERMRGFALGLGVRCAHCHVGNPDGSLDGMDFASDEKATRRSSVPVRAFATSCRF